jgi:hypothetical protein
MAQGWIEKLTINGKYYNSTYGENFGCSVSFNSTGTRAVVGARLAPQDSGGVLQSHGRVRVYQRSTSTSWTQLGQDVIAKSASDGSITAENFGTSVAFNSTGDTFIAGGPAKSPGVARVYQLSGSTWVQKGTDISGVVTSSRFGTSVAINNSGTVVAVGAISGNNNGFVAIYEWNGSSWVQIGSNILGESSSDESGSSIALNDSGNIVAIGAPKNNSASGVDSGHVRIYSRSGSSWIKLGQDIDGGTSTEYFGKAVDLDSTGNVLAVCSNTTSAGTKVYDWNGSVWTQRGSKLGSYGANSVSLTPSGNAVAIGSTKRAEVFQWNGSSWIQLGLTVDLILNSLVTGFGDAVALSPQVDRLAVGAPYGKMSSSGPSNQGLVKIFELGTIPDPSPSPSPSPSASVTPTPSVTPSATPAPGTGTPPSIFDVFKKGNEDGFTRFKRLRLLGIV